MKSFALSLMFSLAASTAAFAGKIHVTLPNSGTNIRFTVLNDDGFDITQIKFDLSTTFSDAPGNPPLVVDSTFGEVGPTGGTATAFSMGQFIFGYDFTSFNHGETFGFNLDPDIAGDPSYGAVTTELIGAGVWVTTTGGTVHGTIGMMGRDLGAWIDSPDVPEPTTYALFALGLAGIAALRRKK